MRTNPNLNAIQMRRDGLLPRFRQSGGIAPNAPPLKVLGNRADSGPIRVLAKQTVDLSVARDISNPLVLRIGGNVLIVNGSTFPTDQARIRLNQAGDFFTVGVRWAVYGFPFDTLEVANAAQVDSSLEFIFTTDDPNGRVFFGFQ